MIAWLPDETSAASFPPPAPRSALFLRELENTRVSESSRRIMPRDYIREGESRKEEGHVIIVYQGDRNVETSDINAVLHRLSVHPSLPAGWSSSLFSVPRERRDEILGGASVVRPWDTHRASIIGPQLHQLEECRCGNSSRRISTLPTASRADDPLMMKRRLRCSAHERTNM